MDLDLGIAVAAILFVQEGRKEENVTEKKLLPREIVFRVLPT